MSPDKNVLHGLKARGYEARIVSIDRLPGLREGIEAGRRDGLYDDSLYRDYLGNFVFGPPTELRNARSIVVMAVSQSPVRFTFRQKGKVAAVIVPATYLHAHETDLKAQETLSRLLAHEGYRTAPVVLPKKLLAVRSGLAAYGRNNVTYVPGFGSFHRLAAFYTDMPCESDQWREPVMLDRCARCRLCYTACPSGAIAPDRFLIHAERCIVFHNEKPGTVPFPDWIDPAWHNCLVGCVRCQQKCPENREVAKSMVEGCDFGETETRHILAGTPVDQMSPHLADKFKAHDLVDLLDVLPRNLAVLL